MDFQDHNGIRLGRSLLPACSASRLAAQRLVLLEKDFERQHKLLRQYVERGRQLEESYAWLLSQTEELDSGYSKVDRRELPNFTLRTTSSTFNLCGITLREILSTRNSMAEATPSGATLNLNLEVWVPPLYITPTTKSVDIHRSVLNRLPKKYFMSGDTFQPSTDTWPAEVALHVSLINFRNELVVGAGSLHEVVEEGANCNCCYVPASESKMQRRQHLVMGVGP